MDHFSILSSICCETPKAHLELLKIEVRVLWRLLKTIKHCFTVKSDKNNVYFVHGGDKNDTEKWLKHFVHSGCKLTIEDSVLVFFCF
jgi:hypothetical protein